MRVIAEVGSNWQSFEHCKDSIALAKNCGAWAVKFQAFDHLSLYGFDGPSNHSLPLEWLPKLSEKAKACGIEFMCTAFSPELLEVVDPYVKHHKIASSDLTHKRLLEAVNKTKKPVFLSTGAHGMADVEMALKHLKNCPVTLMYCVAEYPARMINLEGIQMLRRLNPLVGYSDHSTDVNVIPLEAKRRGAVVIEKHVNLVGVTDTPDAPHSLTLEELKAMILNLEGKMTCSSSERDMYLKHNRRLVATQDIRAGERLIEGKNFGAFRSKVEDTKGVSCWLIDFVHNQVAHADIKQGESIGPEHVKI